MNIGQNNIVQLFVCMKLAFRNCVQLEDKLNFLVVRFQKGTGTWILDWIFITKQLLLKLQFSLLTEKM